jgi:hypothetical protein
MALTMEEKVLKPLPFMKTTKDAIALCEKEQDNFFLMAFMIEGWLGHVVLQAVKEYAEKKEARDRAMQTGQAWRGFLKVFGQAGDKEFPHILVSMLRFTEYDGPLADMLRQAILPISFEHESTGDFIGPNAPVNKMNPREALLARRTVQRWCEWLDAVIHFQTCQHWHLAPECFDPDPEKRELSVLGINQRCFAHLDDFSKSWWQWHHSEAAERFKESPKWRAVGKAMGSEAERPWAYPELDEDIILLWPLVKRHNWTYCDLRSIVRAAIPRPDAYPCESDQEFATYCTNVLSLRKAGSGKSAKNGRPPGYDVAVRLCPSIGRAESS